MQRKVENENTNRSPIEWLGYYFGVLLGTTGMRLPEIACVGGSIYYFHQGSEIGVLLIIALALVLACLRIG